MQSVSVLLLNFQYTTNLHSLLGGVVEVMIVKPPGEAGWAGRGRCAASNECNFKYADSNTPFSAFPSPATHPIWTRLKAGDLIERV